MIGLLVFVVRLSGHLSLKRVGMSREVEFDLLCNILARQVVRWCSCGAAHFGDAGGSRWGC